MDGAGMARRAAAQQLGGAMVALGAVAWLVLNGLHGELPGTAQEAVEHLDTVLWRPVHLLTIIAIFVTAAGLAVVTATFMAPWAFVLGRAGTMIAVPAAAVLGVGFAVDGLVLPALAEKYAAGPDEAARMMHIMQADVVLLVIGATSFSHQTLFGIAVTILAVSTLLSGLFPRWLCWLGVAGGLIWLVSALIVYTRRPGRSIEWILLPALPIALWIIGVGWLAGLAEWTRLGRIVASWHGSSSGLTNPGS